MTTLNKHSEDKLKRARAFLKKKQKGAVEAMVIKLDEELTMLQSEIREGTGYLEHRFEPAMEQAKHVKIRLDRRMGALEQLSGVRAQLLSMLKRKREAQAESARDVAGLKEAFKAALALVPGGNKQQDEAVVKLEALEKEFKELRDRSNHNVTLLTEEENKNAALLEKQVEYDATISSLELELAASNQHVEECQQAEKEAIAKLKEANKQLKKCQARLKKLAEIEETTGGE